MKLPLTKLAAGVVAIITCFVVGCVAQSGPNPAPTPSHDAASGTPGIPLPKALAVILHEVKAKSQVPILLPSELPEPIGKAKNALVNKASANEYTISLYYEAGVGGAGFAASFSAQTTPDYDPRGLKRIHEVKLVNGNRGFFRAVSCGGSCSPASLWWEDHGIVYQIQLRLPPSFSEQKQKDVIVAVADSALLGGPR